MEIIAHRGASGYAPENTISAFKKAIELGAKAIEFDVQMTKDGELVVIHDYSLERTTTGKGFVMNTTLEDIKSYDAGSWFSEEFIGEKVPTLKEVLEVVPKDVTLNVEIKKLVLDEREIEKKIFKIVSENRDLENVIFSSFDHECLDRLKKNTSARVGVLISSRMLKPIEYLKQNDLVSYSLNQSVAFVNPKMIKEAHDAGLKVLIYTVNEKSIAQRLEEWNVDAIFSNYPDILNK